MTTIRKLSGAIATISMAWWPSVHADVVTDWNAITLSCVQGGSQPAKRAGPPGLLDIALVQAAVHDAVQAIQGRFEAYEYENSALRGSGSPSAAAAAAAHGVLTGLYGANAPCLANVADPATTYAGDLALQAGAEAAAALLPLYRPTMTLPTDPFLGGEAPGQWRPTPGVLQGANTFMAVTAPFAMRQPAQFRPASPPTLKSWRYVRDYYEVKEVGSASSTIRTPEQTEMAYFWTANFFSQFNEAVRGIASERVHDVGDAARLFALVAFAAADSQISIYDAKYHYNFWRPITAIQHGSHDGNRATIGDPAWTPLVPTPPYPENSSGANCLTAAITTVLQRFFKTDRIEVSIRTTSPNATVNPRAYTRLSDVQREMVETRIYQGIHFRTSEEVGRRQGVRIGCWTFSKYLRPMKSKK
jgi:hypothetical protein